MKSLIIYFSHTGENYMNDGIRNIDKGNTKKVAEYIKDKLNCDILELTPQIPFSNDYDEVVNEYQNNKIDNKIVLINDINLDLSKYDEIILGTPVWWYTICPVVVTFLKQYDLSNKKVYLYATNAGWLGHTFNDFNKLYKNCNEDKCMNIVFSSENINEIKTSYEEIDNWLKEITSNE